MRSTASKHDVVGGLKVDSVREAGEHEMTALTTISPPDITPALLPTSSEG